LLVISNKNRALKIYILKGAQLQTVFLAILAT